MNKKIMENITRKNIQSEKRKNIMLIIAIALASFLICFSGLTATSLVEIQKKQIEDTYEAIFMNVSEEKLLKIKETTEFERVGQYYILGDLPSKDKYIATFFYMDDSMLYMVRNQIQIVNGKIPENSNQIAVCESWLKKYESNKNVGDKITLDTGELSGEYIISGILDMETSGETFPFLVSEETIKNYSKYDEKLNMAYVHLKEQNAEVIKEYCSIFAEKNNLSVVFNSQYFRWTNQIVSVEQLGILGIFIALVLIGTYTVIRSIFQISIVSKIQNYGQLRTIGATQKQIKYIVKREGKYLGFRGMALGITLGVLSAIILMPKGIKVVNYVACVVITFLICSAIISLSVKKPAKIASKISPVESIRITAADNLKTVRHKKHKKLTPRTLGVSNFKREPKKVCSILISLSLGGIMLLCVSSGLLLQSPERMAQHYFGNVDYKIYIQSDREHTDLLYTKNPLNEKLRQEINDIQGVKSIQTLRKSATFTFRYKENEARGMCDMLTKQNEKELEQSLINGRLPNSPQEILVKSGYKDFGEDVKVGMEFEISLGREKVPVTVSGIFQSTKAMISEGNGRGGFDAAMMYMTEEGFMKLLPGVENYDYTWGITVGSKEKNSIAPELQNIVAQNGNIGIESFEDRVDEYKNANVAYSILQIISVIISLFGIINLVNTVLSNQLSRKYEYSILRSIGLTEKQLYKLIICEGMCYSVCSICMTLVIGIPIALLICRQMSLMCYGKVIAYSFPMLYMGLYILAVVLIQFLLSVYQISEQKKKSIVEQLREE